MECDEAIFLHDILTTYVFTMLYAIVSSVTWGGAATGERYQKQSCTIGRQLKLRLTHYSGLHSNT